MCCRRTIPSSVMARARCCCDESNRDLSVDVPNNVINFRCPRCISVPRLAPCRIQAPMHLFGSFKARSDFFCNRNRIFGARIATHPSRILAQREYSEATQLNPVASSKPISNGVKDGIHDYFEILSRQIIRSQTPSVSSFDVSYLRAMRLHPYSFILPGLLTQSDLDLFARPTWQTGSCVLRRQLSDEDGMLRAASVCSMRRW